MNSTKFGGQVISVNNHIQLDQLSLAYGSKTVIDSLSLNFEAQKTYAIVGPSGCGKSTLLYAIAGLMPPTKGQILVDGAVQKGLRPKTAMVLQEYGLFPWKTVWDNLALGLTLRGRLTPSETAQVQQLAELLGLEGHLCCYPGELSGGQKQRVAIGRSWAVMPDLLLMDEPFSSLDALTREDLQDTVVRLYQQNPASLILVTHSIEEAVYLGQTILLMAPQGGRILKTYDNAHFGIDRHRESTVFYQLCQQIRQDLREARHEQL